MKVAVVIPCYKVSKHILGVLDRMPESVSSIVVVDDCCPESSGKLVSEKCTDSRVQVVFHQQNGGVGKAMITGFKKALSLGAEIIVKVDGDGQMDPGLIPKLIQPVLQGRADYAKGNRFYTLDSILRFPVIRRLGNTFLSLACKVSTGYWNVMDPTNGFVAIHRNTLCAIPLEKIDGGYFFETDMLFRLSIARAVVKDVPMQSLYEDEESNLRIHRVIFSFPQKYLNRTCKRIFYNYFLRDFNVATIQGCLGVLLVLFGTIFGIWHWYFSIASGMIATSGTVMLASLPFILGVQLILFAIQYDVQNIPTDPLQSLL